MLNPGIIKQNKEQRVLLVPLKVPSVQIIKECPDVFEKVVRVERVRVVVVFDDLVSGPIYEVDILLKGYIEARVIKLC